MIQGKASMKPKVVKADKLVMQNPEFTKAEKSNMESSEQQTCKYIKSMVMIRAFKSKLIRSLNNSEQHIYNEWML